MLEIFHATDQLSSIWKEGLKSPYQLATEGRVSPFVSLIEMDSAETSKMTRYLCRCIFFLDRKPPWGEWVSILISEDDLKVKVGNMSLIDENYHPGPFYEKSIMKLATYLKRKRTMPKGNQDCKNPFTARWMTHDQMEGFREKFGEALGHKMEFEYTPEILVPRLIIPPSEFHRASLSIK